MRLVAASLLVALSLLAPASWIEGGYALGLFPWIQNALVPVTGVVPWPLMGTLLVTLPLLLPFVIWRRWRRGRAQGASRRSLWGGGSLTALRWALYVYALFLLLWGLGYQRVPIERRWGLGDGELTAEQVRDVQMQLIALLRRDAPAVDAAVDEATEERAWRATVAAERALVQQFEGWSPAVPGNIKYPPAGTLMAFGIYGVVSPFTLEANVDPALPPPMRLAIRGHELAHLFGYNGEADANLVGFLAGLRADDAFARYAAALSLSRYAILGADFAWQLQFQMLLPKRARDDLVELRRSNERHVQPTMAKVSVAMNDGYLKSQGVTLGVYDYDRCFELFVRCVERGLVELPEPYVMGEGR